jgi:hypothetical protein
MCDDGAPGWEVLCAARRGCPPAEYAEAERAYQEGATAWCIALRASLALGRLPVPDENPGTACPYPSSSARAWWWCHGYADAEACFARAVRRMDGDKVEVERE